MLRQQWGGETPPSTLGHLVLVQLAAREFDEDIFEV